MKLSQVEWGTVSKAALKEYGEDDIAGLAAEMAYWIVFSLFPFLIFLAALAGIIERFTSYDLLTKVMDSLYGVLEPNTRETLRGALSQVLAPTGGALSFGALISAILALNSASSATETMMKAFNRAYGVEETRNFIIKKLTALGLTLVMVLLIMVGTVLLALGGTIIGLFDLGPFAAYALGALRIIGALAAINLALAILYWLAPNIKQQFQWITPGSTIATVFLALFVGGFTLYVRFFAASSFNKTYGTLAGLIIFLFFLRLASTIILLGAEFNSEAAMRYDPTAIRDKMNDPEKMVPGQQPQPHPQAAREAGVTNAQVARADGGENQDNVFEDTEVAERLRALRERPAASALVKVQAERAQRPACERTNATKAVLMALGASLVAAVVGAVGGKQGQGREGR